VRRGAPETRVPSACLARSAAMRSVSRPSCAALCRLAAAASAITLSPSSSPRSPTSRTQTATSARNGASVASGSAATAPRSAATRGLSPSLARSRAVFPPGMFRSAIPALVFAAGSHRAPISIPTRAGSSGPTDAAMCAAVCPCSCVAVASAPAAMSSRPPPAAAPSGCVHRATTSSGV